MSLSFDLDSAIIKVSATKHCYLLLYFLDND